MDLTKDEINFICNILEKHPKGIDPKKCEQIVEKLINIKDNMSRGR